MYVGMFNTDVFTLTLRVTVFTQHGFTYFLTLNRFKMGAILESRFKSFFCFVLEGDNKKSYLA